MTETNLWKRGKNGSRYKYANFNRLEAEEPETVKILELKGGFRANDGTYIYFVNHYDKYGWSVTRTALYERKTDATNQQDIPASSPDKPSEPKTAQQLVNEMDEKTNNATKALIRIKSIEVLISHLDFMNEFILGPGEHYRLVSDYDNQGPDQDQNKK